MTRDLTIDVGVLMAASGVGAYEHHDSSLKLANRILTEDSWCLAVDSKGRIQYQYEEKLGSQTFARKWLSQLASADKIIPVPSKAMSRGIRTALKEKHFDPEDYKYAENAANSSCKELVSHDPDYSPPVRKILKKVGVKVMSAHSAANT
jgi:hypothetical protein